jgi:cell division protein FtsW
MTAAATAARGLKRLVATPGDKYVVWTVIGLAFFGIVAVYSAVSFLADTGYGTTETLLMKHVLRVGLALGAMFVFSLIDYRWLAKMGQTLVVVAIGLLLLVQVAGRVAGGAERWLDLGLFGFQPSDVAKLALVVQVAALLSKKQKEIKTFWNGFLPILCWIMAVVVLIGLENLSTAALLLVAMLIVCFVGRVNVLHLVALGVVGLVLAGGMLLKYPERAARVESYLGLHLFSHTDEAVLDVQGEGYQAHQARIAFARGGWTGVGPGKSQQRDFLPAPYNDFIFAIIAEEYGLVGAVGLLAVFVVLLFRGFLRVARHAPDDLGLLLSTGVVVTLTLYAFIHAGVSCGLLPVTGLPLPFVSYGGSSMVVNGAMVGILLNVSRHLRP